MNALVKTYWIHAITPLHVGAGEGSGFVDLPVVREKATNWPVVPGSAVKGVLADAFNASTAEARKKERYHKLAFGLADDRETNTSNAGALVFTDGRLVCLPVRSLYGTFAWATCPLALQRLKRDMEEAGAAAADLPDLAPLDTKDLLVPESATSALVSAGRAYFNDLDFTAKTHAGAATWARQLAGKIFPDDEAWKAEFERRFAIVAGDIFDFLCETGTEVSPRVRIDPDQKTAAGKALWYEEALPAETIIGGLVWCDRIFEKRKEQESTPEDSEKTRAELMRTYCTGSRRLQIGGKATVGRGRVRCLFA